MKKKKKIERKNYQPRIFYPAKLSFRSEGEMKTLSDKQKLRIFFTSRPAQQEMFTECLQREGKDRSEISTYIKKGRLLEKT